MVSGADDLVTYLGDHAPFQSMSPEALAELASAASTHTFGAGELVVDYTRRCRTRSGCCAAVPSRCLHPSDGAEPVDTVTPGGVFGYFPLLSGGEVEFTARATEPSTLLRLPGELVRSVFTKPAGLSFLASSAWDAIADAVPGRTAVADRRR